MQVNLKAPLRLIQAFSKRMGNRGRIVNIGSIWAVISKKGRLTYSASKSALLGATRTLAIELSQKGILVNAVCPGFTDTELTRKNLTSKEIKEIEGFIPVGRLAKTNEIAEVVYFIGSLLNSYITGQTIIVDGGYSIQ
jgi:3-oxoacyl-[acyl-carrier protein] reductase